MIESINIVESKKVLTYESSYGNVKYTLPEINKLPFIIILHSLGKNETQAINF